MKLLLIGFDSAWTVKHKGAIVGILADGTGNYSVLGPPNTVGFPEAVALVDVWRTECASDQTIILLDQPTIVRNQSGQRPVENIVCGSVSARLGGMQPANTSRTEMFGSAAPVHSFLNRFPVPRNPESLCEKILTLETYPVLTLIALGWLLPGTRLRGRLPKYNPARKKTFSVEDWKFVCEQASETFRNRGIAEIGAWLAEARGLRSPSKADQDKLDACLCLLPGLHLADGCSCLLAGSNDSGYIVVPDSRQLIEELRASCKVTGRDPDKWVRRTWLMAAGAVVTG